MIITAILVLARKISKLNVLSRMHQPQHLYLSSRPPEWNDDASLRASQLVRQRGSS